MKLSKCRYKFGGALRTKNIAGTEVKRQSQMSRFVAKHAKKADEHYSPVEGEKPRPRLDEPMRKGGRVIKREAGGGTDPATPVTAAEREAAEQRGRAGAAEVAKAISDQSERDAAAAYARHYLNPLPRSDYGKTLRAKGGRIKRADGGGADPVSTYPTGSMPRKGGSGPSDRISKASVEAAQEEERKAMADTESVGSLAMTGLGGAGLARSTTKHMQEFGKSAVPRVLRGLGRAVAGGAGLLIPGAAISRQDHLNKAESIAKGEREERREDRADGGRLVSFYARGGKVKKRGKGGVMDNPLEGSTEEVEDEGKKGGEGVSGRKEKAGGEETHDAGLNKVAASATKEGNSMRRQGNAMVGTGGLGVIGGLLMTKKHPVIGPMNTNNAADVMSKGVKLRERGKAIAAGKGDPENDDAGYRNPPGERGERRLTVPEGDKPKGASGSYARGGWIKGAIKHPGALHRKLGVPEGEKIPQKKLDKAEHSSNETTRKQAQLAETLKGMKK